MSLCKKVAFSNNISRPCRAVKRLLVYHSQDSLYSVPRGVLGFPICAAVLLMQDLSLHLFHLPEFHVCQVLRM